MNFRERNEPAPELRRVWIHEGSRFKTRDGRIYERDPVTGALRCLSKVKGHGKKDRKLRAAMRQAFKGKITITDSLFVKGNP